MLLVNTVLNCFADRAAFDYLNRLLNLCMCNNQLKHFFKLLTQIQLLFLLGFPKSLVSQCRLAIRGYLRKINRIQSIDHLEMPSSMINFLQYKSVPTIAMHLWESIYCPYAFATWNIMLTFFKTFHSDVEMVHICCPAFENRCVMFILNVFNQLCNHVFIFLFYPSSIIYVGFFL